MSYNVDSDDTDSINPNRQYAALVLDFARCSIKLGCLELAHRAVDAITVVRTALMPHPKITIANVFMMHQHVCPFPDKDHLARDQIAAAFHYKGLGYLAQNLPNLAIYCFLHALIIRLGYETLDQKLDDLEAEPRKSLFGGDRTAVFNIKETLAPLRHMPVNHEGPDRNLTIVFRWRPRLIMETTIVVLARDAISMKLELNEDADDTTLLTSY